MIIEDLKSKYTEIKQNLLGKTRFGIYIKPEMSILIFNIEKQKDLESLGDLLKDQIRS